MEIRRLVKSGAASHTISLPKQWLDKNTLKKGDLVYIVEKTDKELSIMAENTGLEKASKEISINVEGKGMDAIQREITSAYINNFNNIVIIGLDSVDKAKDIRRILHDFVALEISEQTSSKIVAQDLLNLKEISIDKTLRRMDMIVRSIMQDSVSSIEGNNMFDSVFHRDFDVNKLYFLMYRLLKSALNDSNVASTFGLTNNDVLGNWFLAVNLENIADNSKKICEVLKKKIKVNTKELKTLYKDVEKAYLDVMKAYFNKDRKLANDVASRRTSIITKCTKLQEKNNTAEVALISNNLIDLENHISSICRLVIDAD